LCGIEITNPADVSTQTSPAVASPTRIWSALQRMTPAPYFFPLPEPVSSPLEGTYAKIDPSWPRRWLCRRCADYRPARAIRRVQFWGAPQGGWARILFDGVEFWRGLTPSLGFEQLQS